MEWIFPNGLSSLESSVLLTSLFFACPENQWQSINFVVWFCTMTMFCFDIHAVHTCCPLQHSAMHNKIDSVSEGLIMFFVRTEPCKITIWKHWHNSQLLITVLSSTNGVIGQLRPVWCHFMKVSRDIHENLWQKMQSWFGCCQWHSTTSWRFRPMFKQMGTTESHPPLKMTQMCQIVSIEKFGVTWVLWDPQVNFNITG